MGRRTGAVPGVPGAGHPAQTPPVWLTPRSARGRLIRCDKMHDWRTDRRNSEDMLRRLTDGRLQERRHPCRHRARPSPRATDAASTWRSDTGPGWLALPFHCRCLFVTPGPRPVDVRATQAAILHRTSTASSDAVAARHAVSPAKTGRAATACHWVSAATLSLTNKGRASRKGEVGRCCYGFAR